MEESGSVVLYPFRAISHLGPMVELAKLIHRRYPASLSFHVLITPSPPETTTGSDTYINTISATTPFITFHHLPTIPLPPDFYSDFIDLAFGIPELYKPIIHNTLVSISDKSPIKAVILDLLSNAAFPVCESLNLPTYYFGTSGVSVLCQFLYLTTIYNDQKHHVKNMYLNIPGAPSLHVSDIGKHFLDQESDSYKNFAKVGSNMTKCSGFIVNSFVGYEQRAVDALLRDECIPEGPTPPVYLVGPLAMEGSEQKDPNGCLKWLDSQPSKSVVFVCFGSLCVFSKEQLREMAIGLERSGQRFLWVVRHPEWQSGVNELDLGDVLPEGFLTRTKDKGLVVKNWAPQVGVLNHESVGGFVFHCGWNSVYESLVAGVPMVAWPSYKEQKMSRAFIVEEIKVGLAVEMSVDGFVTGEEVADKVRCLMEGEEGKAVRQRTLELSERVKAAVKDGGSRDAEINKLVQSWNVNVA